MPRTSQRVPRSISVLTNTANLFLQRTLNNAGTAVMTATSTFERFLLTNGTFNNLSGGVFNLQADRGLVSNGGTNAFNNAGTFRKNTTTGTSVIGIPFNNTGTVEVQTGILELNNGGTSSGAFNVSAAAAINFAGGTKTLQAGSSISAPTSTITFSGGGTTTVGGDYNAGATTVASNVTFTGNVIAVGNTLTITNGAIAFNSNDVTVSTLNLQNGTLGGSASTTVDGIFNWTGGTMSGSGATNIGSSATLAIQLGTSFNLFLQRTLNNAGTATLTSTVNVDRLFFFNGTFNNLAGALFDLQADRGLVFSGGTNAFNNAGTFRKSTTTGTSAVSIPFINTGTVQAQAGILGFSSTYAQTSGITLLSGGNLSKTGAGIVNIVGGSLEGAGTITGPVSNSGTIRPGASAGCLTITGNYTQTASGVLEIEVGGATACGQRDQLQVSGVASLAGTLTATLTDGFTPTSGQTFPVVTYGSRTGTFTTVNGPFTASYNANDVTLTAPGGAQPLQGQGNKKKNGD